MKNEKRKLALVILAVAFSDFVHSQEATDMSSTVRVMTMESAISIARENSVAALEAKADFVSDYWAYRSYQASRLPSLSLYGNLASFDRSLRQLQNFETGELVYTGNYNMQNSL